MIQSIELQVISRILTSDDENEIDTLCAYDSSYYNIYNKQIEFIFEHRQRFGHVPDMFTFQSEFMDDNISIVDVREPLEYLESELRKNKQHIIFLQMMNRIKDLGAGDVSEVWQYIGSKYDEAVKLDEFHPLDVIHDAQERAEKVIEFSKQTRIPTGFNEIDKLMYGGLSTVEELLVIVARTNSGKSWICVRMMEAAQKAGFPVAYYSPEMQGAYLSTRFDTWRQHFRNSDLFRGNYSDEYKEYIKLLQQEETSAWIFEDKDMADGVSVRRLEPFIKKNGIKLLIIDGLSYMEDDKKSTASFEKFKNICIDLFNMSKKYGCAVVVSAQANRDTKETKEKDEKGVPFPDLYHISGSDSIARIATQVFAVRQIFDKNILDIRLEKSRNAANTRPVISYSWDVNNGNMQYITDGDSNSITPAPTVNATPQLNTGPILGNVVTPESAPDTLNLDDDEYSDVEF